ncbi:MAG: hypothetical protein R3234_13445 [Thermoanaerobaculia bacterium]|nr:hypothetical protein [Thermoanaerobaculia bacterium]
MAGASSRSWREAQRHAPAPIQGDPSLRRLYRGYRRRQAEALVRVLPRDAVRPLYRRAREWAVANRAHEGKDPLATLVAFCEELLPLPPYPVWLADFRSHRDGHLEEIQAAPGPVQKEPVEVDIRRLRAAEERWYASLNLFLGEDVWRGFVAFRREGRPESVRTTDIFRGESAREIRKRFREFDEETLRAFLRSTLP